ncbi:MAG: hypothetical protein M1839_001968 [Geoglossum umbratile]|nr:MAG: hypothetical protein M1839_001968 [Geoglossum umbratile]
MGAVLSDDEYTNAKLRDMAKLLDIDTDLWTFKRFRKLNIYNLLHLQHRLTKLETELCDHLDRHLSIDELMLTIRHNACLALSSIGKVPTPSKNTISLLNAYSNSHLREIQEELDLDKDGGVRLMSLAETEKTWIHQVVDGHRCLRKIFCVDDTANPMAMIYSESHVRKAERLLLTLSFCALLLGPIILLSYTRNKGTKLGIVASFVTSASLLTAGLTKARNWEILTVTAG